MLFLDRTFLYVRDCIGLIGVLVIVVGAARSVYHMVMLVVSNKFNTNYIRLQFGNSVILGLEFMVGADIVGSVVEPDYYSLGLLAILVAIRTVLSYFLNIELTDLTPAEQKKLAKNN